MRRIVTSIIGFVVICSIYSQSIIPFKKGVNLQELIGPTVEKEIQGNSAIYTICFNNAQLISESVKGRIYQHISVSNTGLFYKVGQPKLPMYYSYTPVMNMRTKVRLIDAEYIDYYNIDIYPSQPLSVYSDTISDMTFEINNDIYNKNSYLPQNIVEIEGIHEYKGTLLAKICTAPVQYNPAQRKIRCYSKIVYAIDNIQISENINRNSQQSQDDYFIVCTDSAIVTLSDFIGWKKKQGFRVHLIHKNYWNSSTEVWDSIHSNYALCNLSSRKFLLLVGNHSMVPSTVVINSFDRCRYTTDYQYACMNNQTDGIPDIAIGRIPCNNQTELMLIADKIIKYQKTPQYSGNAVNIGFFEVMNNNVQEKTRLVRTSEDIKSYIEGFGYNCIRIYKASEGGNPMYYSDFFADGALLPNYLRFPYFLWDGNATDIVNEINLNPNIVLYNGHGSYDSWSSKSFMSSNISQLYNSFFPIALSIACETGQYAYVFTNDLIIQRICLAYELLKKNNRGMSSIIAATSDIYAGISEMWEAGWCETMFPEPGLNLNMGQYFGQNHNYITDFCFYPNDYTIGNAFNGACIKVLSQFETSNNYAESTIHRMHTFGDPSSELYTGIPEDLSVVDVKQVNDSIIINTNGIQNCKVLLIPKDESQSNLFMMADSISGRYAFPNVSTSYNISIQKHNCALKYYDSYDVYLQNKEFNNGAFHYEGRNVYIGKNVTNEAPQGNVVVNPNAHLTVKGIQSVQTTDNFEVKSSGTFNIE